jgi:AcrR family transcriptional regulator
MARPRFENLDEDRQQKLLDSAAEEFASKGYDAASLNRILERSGMSKSSLYYYFDDKADLFTTLMERSLAFLFREIGGFDLERLTKENFWGECETFTRRCIELMSKDAWYVKLGRTFYRLRGNPKEGAPTARTFNAARRWIGALLARGQSLGVIRNDLPAPLLIDCTMGMGEAVDRWTVAHWDELDDTARLRLAPEMIDLFRRLLNA